MKHILRKRFTWVFALALAALLIIPIAAFAHVATDQADYSPGSVVTISGDNSDGAGYAAGETVNVDVSGPNGYTASCAATADGDGAWSCQVTLRDDESAIGGYSYTTTGQSSGFSESGTFTDGNAPGSLNCPLSGYNNTHYALQVGTTVTCTIVGATDVSDGPVTVFIKSSALGNTLVTGTASGGTITFTFTAPSNGCQTTNVAYKTVGNTANNDIIDDGNQNGSGTAAAGFAYVDSNGNTHTCGGTTPKFDLTVSKTATPSFTRTFTWGITKKVDKTEIDIADGGSATFNYTVNVTHDSGTDSAWQVDGMITVNNPNSFAVSNVDVTDSVDNGGLCTVTNGTGQTVLANNSIQRSYTCTYSSAPSSSDGINTAIASWIDFGSLSTSATGTATFAFSTPTTIVDGSVTVNDTLGGTLGTVSSTDPSPMSFKYSHTFTGDSAGTCTTHDNTATFTTNTTGTTDSASKTVKVCVGADLTVSKDANPSFTRTFHWHITKDVDKTEIDIADGKSATFNYTVKVYNDGSTDSGWVVNGTITVNNPNNWEAINANLADAVGNGGSCSVSPAAVLVPASGSATASYTCTYASAPSPTDGTNTATATWDKTKYSTPTDSASGSAAVNFSTTNPTIVDDSVTVVDTLGGNLGTVSSSDSSPTSFTYSHTFTSDPGGTCTKHDNTATFTTNTSGTQGSASAEVKVCVGKDLTASKTATPTFKRTYNWSISKAVDKTLVEQIGGTATFNYTVNASETDFIDSAWVVTGKITVSNLNDWEDIVANVSDAVDNGGSCSVTGGTNVTVLHSSSVTLDYTCTFSSGSSGTNTATATWDKDAASTPNGSASGTASFAFTTPTATVNKTITVTDTFNGGSPTTLGTLTATDSPPFASATYNYSRIINVPANNCIKYTNIAKIVETGQSDSKTVEVCGPAKTGALTMGYWQNKNGQAIITGGASTGGVCNSGTWLRQYAPFQDLSATATCAQVATYVTNVIKAANASGASMNAMLKAQMLATALDVYFSDSTLGGNKISAPASIGGVTIDLTKICKMIDSTSGTATCSGTYQNVSSAFGGATSRTVSQILAYAASQSNAGGSVWYGQVKATQELAKNTFDAINNQVAFAP